MHPNEVDRKRIERAIRQRIRYRYVTPRVREVARGYRIESPCCSGHVDPSGGIIDIARLEFLRTSGRWRLYHRDHLQQKWRRYADYETLAVLLQALNDDRGGLFWQ